MCTYVTCIQQLGRVEQMVFTARCSYATAVLGFIILFVHPSHACFVTNPKNLSSIFYTTWKGILLVKCDFSYSCAAPDNIWTDLMRHTVPLQWCQVARFQHETAVFRRPLRPPVWEDLSPVFTFYLRCVQRQLLHTRWETGNLLLDHQAHPCLLIYTVLTQSQYARHVAWL